MGINKKLYKGFSLIEILVVVAIFAILAAVATQSTVFSLRGARKSDATIKVRENLNFALSIVERQLRNARTVNPCPGAASQLTTLSYVDQYNIPTSFSCNSMTPTGNGYIASGSARLTSSDIALTQCHFACIPGQVGLPPAVNITLTGYNKLTSGPEASLVTVDTRILLRIY